jgi:hypothetical protein
VGKSHESVSIYSYLIDKIPVTVDASGLTDEYDPKVQDLLEEMRKEAEELFMEGQGDVPDFMVAVRAVKRSASAISLPGVDRLVSSFIYNLQEDLGISDEEVDKETEFWRAIDKFDASLETKAFKSYEQDSLRAALEFITQINHGGDRGVMPLLADALEDLNHHSSYQEWKDRHLDIRNVAPLRAAASTNYVPVTLYGFSSRPSWVRQSDPPFTGLLCRLPQEVFDRLKDGEYRPGSVCQSMLAVRSYDTRFAAYLDLGNAALGGH